MKYDLMRMLHFTKKLELLIDNCPKTQMNDYSQCRVSLPKVQTKDAIEQLRIHVEKLIENEKTK